MRGRVQMEDTEKEKIRERQTEGKRIRDGKKSETKRDRIIKWKIEKKIKGRERKYEINNEN